MGQTQYVTFEQARLQVKKHGVAHGNKGTSIRRYFGPDGFVDVNSEAYRVDVEPGVEHRAHFHHVDQFQVFFGASDTLHQSHRTGPLLVQYTDADTMYGPFSAGQEPYKYFTMRKRPSLFTGFIPEDKGELVLGRKKRHYKSDLHEWLEAPLPTAGEAVVDTFQPESEDGLAGYTVLAGAGATFQLPGPGSGGQYQLVVSGSARSDEDELPQFTIGYAGPDDRAAKLVAGAEGLRMLVLQFGRDRAAA